MGSALQRQGDTEPVVRTLSQLALYARDARLQIAFQQHMVDAPRLQLAHVPRMLLRTECFPIRVPSWSNGISGAHRNSRSYRRNAACRSASGAVPDIQPL